jgi:NADH-quinone oxidoreductase subunit M
MGVVLAQAAILGAAILPSYITQVPYIEARGTGYLLSEHFEWFNVSLGNAGSLVVYYSLGLDGINVLLIGLTLLVMGVATAASRHISHRPRTYWALFLLLNTALLGCFFAQDLFLFYIFYELMLVPLFFLIGGWGTARSGYAALKFFLFTLAGSVAMLLVMVGLYFSTIDPLQTALALGLAPQGTGALRAVSEVQHLLFTSGLQPGQMVHSFSLPVLLDTANRIPGSLFADVDARFWGFLALFVAFAVKLPAVPLHTWLPDAHVEASTPISIVLAGVLLKVGGYGLIRLAWGLFPAEAVAAAPWVGCVAVASTLYPALIALAQADLKRMVAYSSVAHMGLVLLGIASLRPEGVNGALFQLFNHGVVSASLFLLVGILYERSGSRTIGHFQGLWQKMPRYTFFVGLSFFAGLGLPGLSLFVSELLIFAGGLASEGSGGPLPRVFALLALPGLVLGAGYFLRAFRRMFFGPFAVNGGAELESRLTDLTPREIAIFALLAIFTVLPGILPHWFLNLTDGTVAQWCAWVLRTASAG